MHECRRCGAQYSDSFLEDWGTTNESSGMGPEPVCAALRESRSGPKMEDGRRPLAVCRGPLTFVKDGEPDDASRAVQTTRIGERRPAPDTRPVAADTGRNGSGSNA